MEKIRIYHIDESLEAQQLVKSFVQKQASFRVVGSSSSAIEGIEEISRLFPDIVIIDENTVPKDLTFFIQKLLQNTPYLGIIITTSEYSSQKLKQYMHVGARGYLAKPFNSSELVDSIIDIYDFLQRLKNHMIINSSRILIRAPKMITVFSTKGGVGKSTIATLLSIGLAHLYKEQTAIIDLDLQFGDISLLMDVKPKTTITNMTEVIDRLESEDIRSFLFKHQMGVHILPSPLKPEEAEFITEASLQKMFTLFKKEFDYTIIDCPPGFTEQAIVALEQSDVILFITSPELISLKNTKLGIMTLKEIGVDTDKIKIVVNRYSDKNPFSFELIEEVLGIPVFASVSEDYVHVIEYLNQGQPELLFQSKGTIKKDLQYLIESLRQYHMVSSPQTKKRKWWNYFKRKK